MSVFRFFIAAVCVIASFSSEARWASFDDAGLSIASNCDISINADGTNEGLCEVEQEILKESGRDRASRYTLSYDENASQITIESAKTIYEGQEYKVAETMIEDKPLASPPHGFDQTRQISIAFPKVEIGAKIFLKYRIKITKMPIDDFYSSRLFFGNDGYYRKARVKIKSAMPLHIVVNDPDKVLKITKDKEDNFHKLELSLVKPIYKAPINEPRNGLINLKHYTWVSISSVKDWKDFVIKEKGSFIKVVNQPLPKEFESIVKLASEKDNEIDQINTVTSLLNEKVQYFGDWRSIEGKFQPRDLAKIVETQVGDCKDFSAATAAMLKALGFKAQVSLVRRGVMDRSDLGGLPDIGNFDHAFVKVTNKHGKVYWIDPTNFISMAGGIFPDIANKMALVLDPSEPSYEKVPDISPEHSQEELERILILKKDGIIDEHIDLTFKGEAASDLTGATLQVSKNTIEDMLFDAVSGNFIDGKNKKSIILPNLSSRIVKDFKVVLNYEHENGLIKTNLGQAYILQSKWAHDIVNSSDSHISDIYIGEPMTIKKRTVLRDVRVENVDSLNYKIETPWVSVSRVCANKGKDVEIFDVIKTLKSFITNEELKTAAYKKLKSDLEKNFKNTAVIIEGHNG